MPHDNRESVGKVPAVLAADTAHVLLRLRAFLNNRDFTEHIPIELRRAGFSRVLFSPGNADIDPNTALVAPVYLGRRTVGYLHAATTARRWG